MYERYGRRLIAESRLRNVRRALVYASPQPFPQVRKAVEAGLIDKRPVHLAVYYVVGRRLASLSVDLKAMLEQKRTSACRFSQLTSVKMTEAHGSKKSDP